jgi:hypothetical protein
MQNVMKIIEKTGHNRMQYNTYIKINGYNVWDEASISNIRAALSI